MAELRGTLTPKGTLSAQLTPKGGLTGALNKTVIQPPEYPGPYIIAPSDTQQILDTHGKALTNDITIKAIPQPELLGIVYDKEVKLEDTGFATWTPSTTAATIRASETAQTIQVELDNYEYLIKWETSFFAEYQPGATLKAQLIYEAADQYQQIAKRPNSLANIVAENFNGNNCTTYFTVPFLRYYNTSGGEAYTHSISYGIYPVLVAATFSNSTYDRPNLTIKAPSVSARCYGSYFATARAPELDQSKSKIHIVGKLYRRQIPQEIREMYKMFYDRYIAEGAV